MNVRMQRYVEVMNTRGLDALALNPGPSLIYLSGLHFHLMERPTVLLLSRSGRAVMVLPELERGKLQGAAAGFIACAYGDDPAAWPAAFAKAAAALGLQEGRIGLEPTRLRYLELQYLQEAFPNVDFVDGGAILEALRILKEPVEVEKMRQAARIAQAALLETLKHVETGITEKALANELVVQLLRAGSDPELPFQPIVAFGESSANPHAVPTDRALRSGDLILIDWGAGFEGYFSDITRTFTWGAMDPEWQRIGKAVLAANRAGRAAGKPGLDAGAVDRAARAAITAAGYGPAFTHRTGHGLGMEAHEAPYIFGENDLPLAAGMTFTVEPGIYLGGRGGVRIEDDVVVTADGLESLTDLPRQVLSVEDYLLL